MKRLYFLSTLATVILIFVCILVSSCITVSSPPVVKFSVSPTEIESGSPVILMWNVANVNSITIDQSIGKRDAVGSLMVTPKVDTTYTITATNSAGTSTKSVSVKVLPRVMSSKINKPGQQFPSTQFRTGLQKELIGPATKIALKTYKETLYDFVEQAPTGTWTGFKNTKAYVGTPENNLGPLTFPCTSPELRNWNNIILEDGITYKESLYMGLRVRSVYENGQWTDTADYITGEFPVTIPYGSWFTAKIGVPALSQPPPADQLVLTISFLYIEINSKQTFAAKHMVYYDDYVDMIDFDLSKMAGTNGKFFIVVYNNPPGSQGLVAPVAFVDCRIARP